MANDIQYLTPDELLTMTCSPGHRHEIIYARCDNADIPPEPVKWRVRVLAEHIIKYWDCDFLRMGIYDPFFNMCVDMYEDWDDDLCDPITIEKENPEDTGFLIGNGHHRSLTRACLLLTGQVEPTPKCLKYSVSETLPISRGNSLQFYLRKFVLSTDCPALRPIDFLDFRDFIQARTHRDILGFETLSEIAEFIIKIRCFTTLSEKHPFFAEVSSHLRQDYLFPQDPWFIDKVELLYSNIFLENSIPVGFSMKVVPGENQYDYFIENSILHKAVILTTACLLRYPERDKKFIKVDFLK